MTGESFCLYLPRLDGDCFAIFLHELAKDYPEDLIVLFADNAPAHIKTGINIPENVILLHFPPYSPELNPVERWFEEFRKFLANKLFDAIDHMHQALNDVLELFTQDKERLELLTNFPWWWFGVTQLNCDFYPSV